VTELAVGIMSFIGVLATAGVAWQRVLLERERRRTEIAECEIKLQNAALSFSAFLEDWGNTEKEMSDLISSTEIDRILVLRAWNGSLDPKWTTAVYQMRECGQEPRQYVHFELDADYVDRLRSIVGGSSLHFKVWELPPSFIRSVYEAEGVTASCWVHIDTAGVAGTSASVITYASFSTHSHTEVSADTQTRCMILAGRLKGLAYAFRNQIP
jgi:hypothetical protein